MEHYSAIKMNEILPFAVTWMDLEVIRVSEISQRQVLYDITCGIWKVQQTSEYDKKEADPQRRS